MKNLLTAFLFLSLFIPLNVNAAQPNPFLHKVLAFLGISPTPSALRGPGEEIETGNIWIVDRIKNTQWQVTKEGGYRSPVFLPDDKNVLAVKGEDIVRIPTLGGVAKTLYTIKGIVKMVGFSKEDQDEVLILLEDKSHKPSTVGLLSLTNGQVTNISYGKSPTEDENMLNHIRGWERVYGNTTVDVKTESKPWAWWTDVYIKESGKSSVNLSQCEEVNCGQPSLSHDGHQVVFIKE